MTSIAFYTLGCRSNQYETNTMADSAAKLGFDIVPYPAKADIYVINTCTVTGLAARKSRNTIRHSRRLNPKAKIIFTGCDAELESVSEADLVINNKDKKDFAAHLRKIISVSPLTPYPLPHNPYQVRSNLMIETGCENYCTYCIVPYVRGKVRSRPMKDVLADANNMVANGVREIVLTGINIGEFPDLNSLISEISSIDELLRIRLSSIEPQYVTDDLIQMISDNPKVCKHLHIPLQSGDDGILKRMNRKYTAKGFRDMVTGIRNKIKDIAITTDIIVGFPGEDEKAFNNTLKFAEKIGFSRIHIFSYSDRPGTKAEKMGPKIDPKVIAQRHKKLDALKAKLANKFNIRYSNKNVEILIESKDKKTKKYEGLTSNYIRVATAEPSNKGELKNVRLRLSDIIPS